MESVLRSGSDENKFAVKRRAKLVKSWRSLISSSKIVGVRKDEDGYFRGLDGHTTFG